MRKRPTDAADDDARERFSLAIGYLRAAATVLVVAHHAVLAYHPFAPPPLASLVAQPRWWLAFPIADSQRWSGFALLVGWNDLFFMSLLFFLSGLFVWPSLRRKGSATFLRDRALRLGLPFIIAAAIVAPLAYYPAYLTATATAGAAPGPQDFWTQWRSLGMWPGGPAWFLWVLLTCGALAAALFRLAPAWGDALGRRAARVSSPAACFAGLVIASAIVYVPMTMAFGAGEWVTVGPFAVQTSRVPHYALYFACGLALGASAPGAHRGLLAPDGPLARRWLWWTLAVPVCFFVAQAVITVAMTQPRPALLWSTLAGLGFALTCAASCFGLVSLALRWTHRRVRALDSLQDNAYGIYLVHYAIVSWLQYAVLGIALPGAAKGAIVFLASLLASWLLTAVLRRIPAVARLI